MAFFNSVGLPSSWLVGSSGRHGCVGCGLQSSAAAQVADTKNHNLVFDQIRPGCLLETSEHAGIEPEGRVALTDSVLVHGWRIPNEPIPRYVGSNW
jgi:hypothetical protein